MSLQVQRGGIRVPGDDEIAAWRAEFDARHGLVVAALVAPDLLAWIRRRVAAAPFEEFVHDTVDPPAVDLFMSDPTLHATLSLIFNDRRLFEVVRRIAGCGAIGSYHCRVLGMDPSRPHADTWHSDVDGTRLVAMSVNIGDPYEGGVLRLRADGEVHELGPLPPGAAALFRIRQGLEHMATPVTGARRRTALVGWFQRPPLRGAW